MANKKKKKHKKHSFKHSAPVAAVKASNPAQGKQPAVAAPPESGFDYVASDVKRIAIMAASFAALQIGLWYLFNNTSLGPAVYQLIKL